MSSFQRDRASRRFLTSAVLGVACLVMMLAGCDTGDRQLPRRREKGLPLRIVLVGRSKDDPTWPILRSIATEYEAIYPNVTVKVIGPDRSSPSQQQAILKNLLEDEADAVCVDPVDPLAIRSGVKGLVSIGKPVVTIGEDVPNSGRSVYCGPAESEIGRAAAEASQLAIRGRSASVMLLYAGDDHELYRWRYYAFRDELASNGGILLLKKVNCHANDLDAERLVRTQSRLFPRVGCWVFLDDWPLRAIRPEERLLPLGCGLVLCNGSPEHFERMHRGEIQALITYDYYTAVQDALMAASQLVEHRSRQQVSIIATPTEIITQDTLKVFERRWRAWQHGKSSKSVTGDE